MKTKTVILRLRINDLFKGFQLLDERVNKDHIIRMSGLIQLKTYLYQSKNKHQSTSLCEQ